MARTVFHGESGDIPESVGQPEVAERRDELLRSMLKMPPKPHQAENKHKSEQKRSRPQVK